MFVVSDIRALPYHRQYIYGTAQQYAQQKTVLMIAHLLLWSVHSNSNSFCTKRANSNFHHYLHFCNNQDLCQRGKPGYDRLSKVQKIMEKLQERFLTIYQPHCEIAIDEAMIPSRAAAASSNTCPKRQSNMA